MVGTSDRSGQDEVVNAGDLDAIHNHFADDHTQREALTSPGKTW
jgi:hypothetical protein